MKLNLARSRAWRAAAVAAAGALAAVSLATAAPAGAATRPHQHMVTQAAARIARDVRQILVRNPGSRQISPNSVRLERGVVMTVRPASASGKCPGGFLCLFQNTNFDGYQITLGRNDKCDYIDLTPINMPTGTSWANQASSIDNPQPRPSSAWLYHDRVHEYTLNAGSYLKDLTHNTALNGHSMNDYITSVATC